MAGSRRREPAHWLALVHIEIESPDKIAPLRPRMFDAYVHLRRQHGLPVLPIGLYLRVGLDGVGTDVYEEHFWELRPVHFEYLYVGLPALDAVEYVQGTNWLGVALAALMGIPKDRVAWLGAEALRRIQTAPLTDQQRFLWRRCPSSDWSRCATRSSRRGRCATWGWSRKRSEPLWLEFWMRLRNSPGPASR